jgi:hypothetical protein
LDDRTPRAEGRQEALDECHPMARPPPGHIGQGRLRPVALEAIESRDELGQGVVPGDRLVASVATIAGPFERLRDAIRMVGHLDRRLAARAEPPVIDGMVGAPLELLGRVDLHDPGLPVAHDVLVGVHHANREPAPGWTQRADPGFPRRDARIDIFVRHEADELVFRAAATDERSARAGDCGELDEISAVHAVRNDR